MAGTIIKAKNFARSFSSKDYPNVDAARVTACTSKAGVTAMDTDAALPKPGHGASTSQPLQQQQQQQQQPPQQRFVHASPPLLPTPPTAVSALAASGSTGRAALPVALVAPATPPLSVPARQAVVASVLGGGGSGNAPLDVHAHIVGLIGDLTAGNINLMKALAGEDPAQLKKYKAGAVTTLLIIRKMAAQRAAVEAAAPNIDADE
jgi:hypothetical protein